MFTITHKVLDNIKFVYLTFVKENYSACMPNFTHLVDFLVRLFHEKFKAYDLARGTFSDGISTQ